VSDERTNRWPALRGKLVDAPGIDGKPHRLEKVRETLQAAGTIKGEKGANNVWLFNDDEADAIREAVRLLGSSSTDPDPKDSENDDPPDTREEGGSDADGSGKAGEVTDGEPSTTGETPEDNADRSVEELANREGPKKQARTPGQTAGGDPKPDDEDDDPEPKKKGFRIPKGVGKWVAIGGAALIAFGLVRAWWQRRQRGPAGQLQRETPLTALPADPSQHPLRGGPIVELPDQEFNDEVAKRFRGEV